MRYVLTVLLLIDLFNFNNCGLRQDVLHLLKLKYGENPIHWDISGDIVLELYASKSFRTWSVIITHQDNLQSSCIIAHGRGRNSLPFKYSHGEDT